MIQLNVYTRKTSENPIDIDIFLDNFTAKSPSYPDWISPPFFIEKSNLNSCLKISLDILDVLGTGEPQWCDVDKMSSKFQLSSKEEKLSGKEEHLS